MTATSITIGAEVIDRLMNNVEARGLFSFLVHPPIQQRGSGCGGCSGRQRESVNYNAIKRRLASLADSDERKLLRILDAHGAKIYYKVGKKQYTKVLPS